MKHQFKIFIIVLYFLSGCQTNSTFDQLDVNTVDLTRITGETPPSQSFFDSALWSAVLSAALLAAISSTEANYNSKGMDDAELESEWIE